MENVETVPGKKWALIQTGSIPDSGDYIPFKDGKGVKVPVVLFSHDDEARVRKMKRRVTQNAARVTGFADEGFAIGQPILGVVQICTVPTVKREPKPETKLTPPQTSTIPPLAKVPANAGKK